MALRRSVVVAAGIAVFLLLVGSVYVSLPLLRSSSQTGTSSSSVSSGGGTSVATSATSQSTATTTTGGAGWTTYHADKARTGYLYVSNFTSVSKGWTSSRLDGLVFAEPLVYQGHVFVATENNSVYSLDSRNGSVAWRNNLGPPVLGSSLPCGNIEPVTGITGTPVIDPSTGLLYVVSYSGMHHTLSALRIATGAVVFQRSATPPGFNDTTQQERTALTLANGMVYFGYGGLAGDCGQFFGWEVGLPADGSQGMVYYKVPTTREGAIWAPSGAVVDSAGNIYVTTGNAASTTTFDYGNSVIKLSPSLKELGFFAPINWAKLSSSDTDLGSLAPAIVGPDTLFQIGKQGVGYILNSSKLGGIGGQVYESLVCSESFGGTAFANSTVFVPCVNGLYELSMGNGTFSTKLSVTGFSAGPPILTGGVAWTVELSDTSATLLGISVATGHQAYNFSLGGVEHFTTPAAGDGQVFVAATDKVMSFVLGQ